MGTRHLLAAPSAPTSHVGDRWWGEAGINGGAGNWHGAQRTQQGGKEPRQSWPITSPLAPSCSQQGRGQGWLGREGLAVNASGRCWSLGLRLSQSQLRAQGHGALKAWVRQRGGIQLSDPRTASDPSTGGGRRGSLFRTGQLTRVSGTQDGLDGVLPPCRSWHRSCPAQVLAAST